MKRFFALLLAVLALALYLLRRHIFARLLSLRPPQNGVRVSRDIAVPMADGVTLMTDHYRPDVAGGYPTVLIRSPYGRGRDAFPFGWLMIFLAQRFAERGYHVVVQTARGQFDSGGRFEPYVNEKEDGLATIDWITRQPWFNGVLGTWGPSYLGLVQWAVAADAPANLKAMVPIITGSQLSTLQFPDEAFALDTSLRWAISTGTANSDGEGRKASLAGFGNLDKLMATAQFHLPLIEADVAAVGQPVSFYHAWLENPPWDDPTGLWRRADHQHEVGQTKAAVHLISGWYDIWVREFLADYRALKAAGHRPYLTIGPWPHISAGPMQAGLRDGLDWLDGHLKGERERLRRKPVRIYVMGQEAWREMDEWPPPAEERRYYLDAGGRLSTTPPAEGVAPDGYRYDPADPTPIIGGTQFNTNAGRQDQGTLEARPDVLVFTLAPLDHPVEVIGPVRLALYARSSLEHTDFVGRLCDVGTDGRSTNVCDGLFRVRPGKGHPQPDGSLLVEVDMWATAYLFKPGHRIRLQVCSAAHPRWSRNTGSGEPLATATRLIPADQTIYHDRTRPSALVLPVV